MGAWSLKGFYFLICFILIVCLHVYCIKHHYSICLTPVATDKRINSFIALGNYKHFKSMLGIYEKNDYTIC